MIEKYLGPLFTHWEKPCTKWYDELTQWRLTLAEGLLKEYFLVHFEVQYTNYLVYQLELDLMKSTVLIVNLAIDLLDLKALENSVQAALFEQFQRKQWNLTLMSIHTKMALLPYESRLKRVGLFTHILPENGLKEPNGTCGQF